MQQPMSADESGDERWKLLRDMLVLQGKLLVDGFRDLLLVPASLVAGILSLVTARGGRPGPQFYELLVFGKRTERWINLFGAIRNVPGRPDDAEPLPGGEFDDLVERLEGYVVDEYRRGGVTARAKERLDKVLDALQRGSHPG